MRGLRLNSQFPSPVQGTVRLEDVMLPTEDLIGLQSSDESLFAQQQPFDIEPQVEHLGNGLLQAYPTPSHTLPPQPSYSPGQIVKLLNERTKHVLAIGEIKLKAGEEIYAPHRERAVLQRICQLNQGPMTNESLRADLSRNHVQRAVAGEVHDHRLSRARKRPSPIRRPSAASVPACATPRKKPSPTCSPKSARTARITASCRSRIPPKASSRTRSTCSWTAT